MVSCAKSHEYRTSRGNKSRMIQHQIILYIYDQTFDNTCHGDSGACGYGARYIGAVAFPFRSDHEGKEKQCRRRGGAQSAQERLLGLSQLSRRTAAGSDLHRLPPLLSQAIQLLYGKRRQLQFRSQQLPAAQRRNLGEPEHMADRGRSRSTPRSTFTVSLAKARTTASCRFLWLSRCRNRSSVSTP